MSEHVLATRDNGVMTITLNRPDKLNALTFAMTDQINHLLDEAGADSDVRVLVMAGSGRAFCAGDDLKESDPRGDAAPQEYTSIAWHGFVRKLRALPKPAVAAVNGLCCGAGIGLILGCDIRIASRRAQFADIFMRRGIVGGAAALTHLLGASRALELIYTGDFIDAAEAHRIGLFNRVVPHDSLKAEVDAFTQRLTEASAWALARSKSCVYEIETVCLEEALQLEQAAKLECLRRADYRNAVIAFNDGTDVEFSSK
jgi:enoyl-CoA hydratase/carnithine racemase